MDALVKNGFSEELLKLDAQRFAEVMLKSQCFIDAW